MVTIGLEIANPQEPSDVIRVELARPRAWLAEHDLGGGEVLLDMKEVAPAARAIVTYVLPAPKEQSGSGCLVLMTVRHIAHEVLKLSFETGTVLEVTPSHPFFVEGTGWLPAGDLKPGLLLRSDHGPVRLEAVKPAAPGQYVYNLEVAVEHTYRVSVDHIWAHNNCFQEFAHGELEAHFGNHRAEWGTGNMTQAVYLGRARSLLNSDVGGNILGKVRENGDVLRYNIQTNEFAAGRADGTIKTLFRPTGGIAYWIRQ